MSRLLVAIAALLVLGVASWGSWAPIAGGHDAANASMGIVAENMLRWRIPAPVWTPTDTPPDPSQYYCHHPFGIFWTTTALFGLLGRSDFACRLPAIIASVASVLLFYRVGRELFRPSAAALGALGFVCLPITLSFAAFNALEVPLMAWSLVALWGYLRHRRTGARRDLWVLVLGASMALNTDWPAFVLVLGLMLIELGGLRAWPARADLARLLGLAVPPLLIGLAYVLAFRHWGKLEDLWQSAELRAMSPRASLTRVLDTRAYWIELMFTPVGVAVGKAGAVLLVVTALARRRTELFAPIAVLWMCLAQYLLFRQGADVHVFWPHCFALFFAFALAALSDTLSTSVAPWLARRAHDARWAFVWLALLPVLAWMLRDALLVARWARHSGGRFNEKGRLILDDRDKIHALRSISGTLEATERVTLHESLSPGWGVLWAFGGRQVETSALVPRGLSREDGTFVADVRFLEPQLVTFLVERGEARLLGPFLHLRSGEGFSASRVTQREPSGWEWLRGGPAPVLELEGDAFATWDIGSHYGVRVPAPVAEPTSPEQHRVLHNVARLRGDAAAADTHATAAMVGFEPRTLTFSDGTTLRGARVVPGVSPEIELLLEAGGALPRGVRLRLTGRVVERETLSLIPPDPVLREVAPPPVIAPQLWRKGFLYSIRAPLIPRLGRERFELGFAGPGAPRAQTERAWVAVWPP